MTDPIEEDSSRDRPTSPEEDSITTVPSAPNETLAALVNGTAFLTPDKTERKHDDSPEQLRRRSSLSIMQTLINTSHLLSTNDARKRYEFNL